MRPRGKRLCTELEWERACKGDTVRPYPSGSEFDAEACSLDPLSCASPLGAVSLGVLAPEWTASDVSRGLGTALRTAVVRGAVATSAVSEHRCGARHAVDPEASGVPVSFRCCRGPTPEVGTVYPTEPERPAFRVHDDIDPEAWRAQLRSIPELAALAEGFVLSTGADAERAATRGGQAVSDLRWTPLEGVLRWSPVRGEELWVFAGRGGGSSAVAAVYPMPDGTFVHGASFVFENEQVSVAVLWDYGSRHEILWTTCAGVPARKDRFDFERTDPSLCCSAKPRPRVRRGRRASCAHADPPSFF